MDDGEGVSPNEPPTPTRSTLLSTYWRDPEYLANVALTPATVLDYFCRSSFFDPSSTNEMLRMQNIANPEGAAVGTMFTGGMGSTATKTARQHEEELARFVGIEFVLVHAKQNSPNKSQDIHISPGSQPHQIAGGGGAQHLADETLFVIQKRRRQSPVKTTVLETYYILNGNVHMAPDLDTVLNNRMVTALQSLRGALSLARAASSRPLLPASASIKSTELGKIKVPSGPTARSKAPTVHDAADTGGGGIPTLGAEATAFSEQLARGTADLPGDQGEEQDVEMLADFNTL